MNTATARFVLASVGAALFFAVLVFATDALVADATRGTDLVQELRLPADLAPGYYNIVQVSAYDDGNAMSGAGIMHVVARR